MKPVRASKLKFAWLVAAAICAYSVAWYVQRSHACRVQKQVMLSLVPKVSAVGFRPIWPQFLEPYLPGAGPLWRLAAVRSLRLTGANERDVQLAAELPYLEVLELEEPEASAESLIRTLETTQIRSLYISDSLTEMGTDELRRGLRDVDIQVLRSR